MLADALKSGDGRVRSLALSTLKQMATDLQRRPFSQSPSIAQLQQAVSALEEAQQEMDLFRKLRNPENSIALRQAVYASEDEQAIRESLIALRRDIQDYYTEIALTVSLRVLGISILVGAFILWSRPELLLGLSRAIVRAKENREVLAQVLAEVEQFLKQAGATTQRDGQHGLQMTSAPGRLKSYIPLPVTFAEEPVDRDVAELVQSSARLAGKRPQQAGILLYREPPDS